ncbi:Fc.00g086220.m01.CDS01 [Cosmosporella sp. VM-42]
MHQRQLHHARIAASVAATFISLACGSNYVYSAWAPQFAERLKLSSTESNLIGLAGNLGMYSMGVPIGMFVDHKGPRPAVLAGTLLLAIGYFPLHQSYERAAGTVAMFCLFSYLSGLGGCMAFAAAVKTSALNWPHHRGTATAFPLAAFGLSAFFFSLLGSVIFPGDPSGFLMLLAWGTSGMTFIGFFFLKVHPNNSSSYHAVPGSDRRNSLSDSQQLQRTSSDEPKTYRSSRVDVEPGMSFNSNPNTSTSTTTTSPSAPELVPGNPFEPDSGRVVAAVNLEDPEMDETSSLVSSRSSLAGDVLLGSTIDLDRSHRVDIRGLKLLSSLEFWQLFSIMGILAGIGLMTINNIGNDAKALWKHYDDTVSDEFLIKRQQMHVSILSVCSFLGRLSSGVGSDFLVKNLHASRVWCLVFACFVFFLAQICALNISNPHLLGLVSGLSGLGYGFLFGVFPSIVAETFGIHGLSQNWGFMTLSPVVSSNVFNIFYGKVYDKHSVVQPGGERFCLDGLGCYRAAYWVTLGACGAGLFSALWVIRHQRAQYLRENRKGEEED